MCFKRKKEEDLNSIAEQRFDDMMALIKDLPRRDYAQLKQAMDLSYEAYQKIKVVRTEEEKEYSDIDDIENSMEKEER